MDNLTQALRKPLICAAILFSINQLGHAEEAITAPNSSQTPSAKPAQNPTNLAAPLTAPSLKSGEEPGEPPVSWNDTYVGYRYGQDFRYPGSSDKIILNIGNLTTIGGFKYGSYAFNVDYMVANAAHPEAGGPSTGGAQEIYSVGRVEASASKILGRSLRFGVIRDYGLTAGYEFGSRNDSYAERARMFVFGPAIEFAVPHGFWNVTAGLRTESNHNGITGRDVHFDTAWHIESSWLFPFRVGPLPLLLRGFASMTGPKGRDGFNTQTHTEFLTRVSLIADLGSFAGHPRVVYAGVSYQYWHNMYGAPSSSAPGTITSTPMLMAEVHF